MRGLNCPIISLCSNVKYLLVPWPTTLKKDLPFLDLSLSPSIMIFRNVQRVNLSQICEYSLNPKPIPIFLNVFDLGSILDLEADPEADLGVVCWVCWRGGSFFLKTSISFLPYVTGTSAMDLMIFSPIE